MIACCHGLDLDMTSCTQYNTNINNVKSRVEW